MSKEKGILFKGEMVRAILEGRKTQTRRLVGKLHQGASKIDWNPIVVNGRYGWCDEHGNPIRCDWQVGDILYVKETWQVNSGWDWTKPSELPDGVKASYDSTDGDGTWGKVRPSMFMPKKIARIWLKVTNVRVERLLDISEADAIAEGIEKRPHWDAVDGWRDWWFRPGDCGWYNGPTEGFFNLWDSTNSAGSHKGNPWVFVIEFERIEKP